MARAESQENKDYRKAQAGQRLKRCFWAIVRKHRIPTAEAYHMASTAIGRTLQQGLGLSTCSKVELIMVVDALKRAVGQAPGRHRRGPTTDDRRPKGDPTKLIQLATRQQIELAAALALEVFGRDFTQDGPFASFLWRMTRRKELRLLTHQQIGKVTEALKQMIARGWKPRKVDHAD